MSCIDGKARLTCDWEDPMSLFSVSETELWLVVLSDKSPNVNATT